MWNEIWNTSQIWISFQNESVRLESELKNSIMALPYLSIPSSICVEMLKFGTFCHFQKAHRAPDRFVSLNNPQKPFCQVQQAGKATETIVNDIKILFKSYLKADGNIFRAAGNNSKSHSNLNLLYKQILCITFFQILFKSDLKELVDIYIQEETTSNFIHIWTCFIVDTMCVSCKDY